MLLSTVCVSNDWRGNSFPPHHAEDREKNHLIQKTLFSESIHFGWIWGYPDRRVTSLGGIARSFTFSSLMLALCNDRLSVKEMTEMWHEMAWNEFSIAKSVWPWLHQAVCPKTCFLIAAEKCDSSSRLPTWVLSPWVDMGMDGMDHVIHLAWWKPKDHVE